MLHTLLLLVAVIDPAAGAVEADVAGDPADIAVDVDLPPPALTASMKARSAAVVQKSKIKDVPVVVEPVVPARDARDTAIVGAAACAGGAAICAVPFGLPGLLVAVALPAAVAGGSAVVAGKDLGTGIGVGSAATLGAAGGGAMGVVVGALSGGALGAALQHNDLGGLVIGGVVGGIAGAAAGAAGGAALALAIAE